MCTGRARPSICVPTVSFRCPVVYLTRFSFGKPSYAISSYLPPRRYRYLIPCIFLRSFSLSFSLLHFPRTSRVSEIPRTQRANWYKVLRNARLLREVILPSCSRFRVLLLNCEIDLAGYPSVGASLIGCRFISAFASFVYVVQLIIHRSALYSRMSNTRGHYRAISSYVMPLRERAR